MKKKFENLAKLKHLNFRSFSQAIYLTAVFFTDNGLFSYASSCAFGFLFSFIPVVLLTLAILVRILHTDPAFITGLLERSRIFSETFDLDSLVAGLLNIGKITSVEIVLFITIFFMARRFFASAMASLSTIFKQEVKFQPLLQQVVILIGEAVFIISAAFIIIFISALRAIRSLPFFSDLISKFPILDSNLSAIVVNATPIFSIFLIVFLFYKQGSRSHPPLLPTFFSSVLCTSIFWAFQKLMRYFLNINSYNFVYGAFSTIIVLLLEVWFFFVFFLFFAEFLFVYQYFDTLVLSELYVLPERDDSRLLPSLKRMLFINPISLIYKKGAMVTYKKNDFVYCQDDQGKCIYYIVKGSVLVMQKNNCCFKDTGEFFGEEDCLLGSKRQEEVMAVTDVELLKIEEETFFELIEKNKKVSKKALSKISSYYSRIYGRMDNNLI